VVRYSHVLVNPTCALTKNICDIYSKRWCVCVSYLHSIWGTVCICICIEAWNS